MKRKRNSPTSGEIVPRRCRPYRLQRERRRYRLERRYESVRHGDMESGERCRDVSTRINKLGAGGKVVVCCKRRVEECSSNELSEIGEVQPVRKCRQEYAPAFHSTRIAQKQTHGSSSRSVLPERARSESNAADIVMYREGQ